MLTCAFSAQAPNTRAAHTHPTEAIGMKGAYSAMRTGYVDEGWAKEHHQLWYDDIRAGKIPAQRSVSASGASGGQPASAQS